MTDEPEDYTIEKIEKRSDSEHPGGYFYQEIRTGKGGLPLKTRLKIWAVVLGGIAGGTVLFLFFITAFFYFFVPVIVFLALWNLFTRKR